MPISKRKKIIPNANNPTETTKDYNHVLRDKLKEKTKRIKNLELSHSIVTGFSDRSQIDVINHHNNEFRFFFY